MKDIHYYLANGKYNGELVYLDYNKINGFKITPKNQIKYNGVVVNEMILINPSFIEKVLKRKIKHKLDDYLQYIVNILDNIDETDEEGSSVIDIALNDLDRYKRTIKNKYRAYLEDNYIELLLKKISVLERELRVKQTFMIMNMDPVKETSYRSR